MDERHTDERHTDECHTTPGPARKKRRTSPKELLREVFWPRDLLPKVVPQARIITWGYGVQIEQMFSSPSQATIFHHAQTFLSDLVMIRRSPLDKAKPLIFLAHSLGGIIVKDALSLSLNDQTHLNEILPATTGVIFLGTPHHGSKLASLGKVAFRLSGIFFRGPNLDILRGLENNSEILERITKSFEQVLPTRHLRVHSFREELDTKGVPIVDASSSSIGYLHETTGTLYANHRGMAKMSSLNDVKFQRITAVIHRWLDESGVSQETPEVSGNTLSLPDGRNFDTEYQICLGSLDSIEARSRIENVEDAYGGTFEWIFDPEIGFHDWLQGKDLNTRYWIHGKPGSGKSTLMKFAQKHHLTKNFLLQYHGSPWVIAAYFFHDRGIEIQKSLLGFLRETLYQILQQQRKIFPLIYPVYHRSYLSSIGAPESKNTEDKLKESAYKLRSKWSLGDLQEALLLIASASTFDINICIFTDALDEHDGNHRDLLSTLDRLSQLTDNQFFRLRLCLAGRQENVFKDAFRDCAGFSIHEHTTDDIVQYTKGRMQNAMRGNLTEDGELGLSALIADVIERAEGVFLWVRLVVDELIEGICEGDSIKELQDLLSGIPSELEELYTRTLRRTNRTRSRAPANSNYERYVMFQIVKCCLNPFSLYDLLAASSTITTGRDTCSQLGRLSVDQLERRLYSRSAGLLDVPGLRLNKNSKIGATRTSSEKLDVQFIHQTVKEYVTQGEGSIIILEGIGDQPQASGFTFIFQYLASLLPSLTEGDFGVNLEGKSGLIIKGFEYYAQRLEQTGTLSANNFFEPAILQLTEVQQCCIVTKILDFKDQSLWPNIPHSIRGRPRAQLLLLYVLSCLNSSLIESLQVSPDDITQEDRGILLSAAVRAFRTGHFQSKRTQINQMESAILETLL